MDDLDFDSPLLDDLISQFHLDDLFDELPEAADGDASVDSIDAASSPDSISSWILELEGFLMKDDVEGTVSCPNSDLSDSFLAGLLAESPDVSACAVVDEPRDGDSIESGSGGDQLEMEKGAGVAEEDTDDDPTTKKRRRQLRNKDAAMRSRERKKMYVKELEMKSNYLEGECRRLGRLLQCFVAENQALRLSLRNGSACGVAGAKQESAVLLLESLLLGSLLWFLGIVCLFTLPVSPRLTVSLGNAGRRERQPCALRGPRNEKSGHPCLESFIRSRRCKASRSKMKPGILALQV
ncbi:hypothetical protein SAY86_010702 [Trapa natans]|uniref:BZIP domain-containing protein n=1 Tax=Trapa natans TaxID=22666 RepID=A0AAN7LM27_TRANT|nr:hypothetical protein SAY86_010702 [Trapa natans]